VYQSQLIGGGYRADECRLARPPANKVTEVQHHRHRAHRPTKQRLSRANHPRHLAQALTNHQGLPRGPPAQEETIRISGEDKCRPKLTKLRNPRIRVFCRHRGCPRAILGPILSSTFPLVALKWQRWRGWDVRMIYRMRSILG
jgi:hypothetical protein